MAARFPSTPPPSDVSVLPDDVLARSEEQSSASRARFIPDKLGSRNVQFWLLQAIGWGGWGGSWVASGIYWQMGARYNLVVLAGMITGLLLTALLRELYQATWDHSLKLRAAALLLGSAIAGAVWQAAKNVALFEVYGPMEEAGEMLAFVWAGYFSGTLSSFYIMLCWSGLYFGIKYYRMVMAERDRAIAAMGHAREAQLRMLRYQLNPHFLFNTLNAISTLVLEQETRKADAMVNRLSAFLRYSLDSDPTQQVTVADEVAALRLYLEIEQVRFEERLTLDFHITEAAERALVPGLLLQPLVENALKYAVVPRAEGGTIAIAGRIHGTWLELEVSDDGPGLPVGFDVDGDAGVGLANVRDRLARLYGAAQSFRIEAGSAGGTRAVIRIPFEVEQAAAP